MEIFEDKKRVLADLPDTCISKIALVDYKNTNLHYRKMVLTKKYIQGMLNMFYTLSEKIGFFSRRVVPPLIADMSAKS